MKSSKPRSFYRPHKPVRHYFTQPSLTKQEFIDECDINNIIKQYSSTGMLMHVSAKAASGMYADLPSNVDFQSAIDTVRQGEAAFASLPARIRDRFANDPAAFLTFVADPANLPEMRELGIAVPLPPEPPKSSPTESSSST